MLITDYASDAKIIIKTYRHQISFRSCQPPPPAMIIFFFQHMSKTFRTNKQSRFKPLLCPQTVGNAGKEIDRKSLHFRRLSRI